MEVCLHVACTGDTDAGTAGVGSELKLPTLVRRDGQALGYAPGARAVFNSLRNSGHICSRIRELYTQNKGLGPPKDTTSHESHTSEISEEIEGSVGSGVSVRAMVIEFVGSALREAAKEHNYNAQYI